MIKRIFLSVFTLVFLSLVSSFGAVAQDGDTRASTGGAQTLEDILNRQSGQKIDDTFRSDATGNPDSAASIASQLGTLGGVSDSEIYRAFRYGKADLKVSNDGPASKVLIQDGGMRWVEFRKGPLKNYGGYLLIGTLILLGLFYLFRGKIMIEEGASGVKIQRFKLIERFGHWLMAGSFIILGITGLISLFGRFGLIPLIGKSAYAAIANVSIFLHNWVSWGFMIGLILVFFMWVLENIPNKADIKWLMQGGGIFKKGVHPPSYKFNAGQKIIFWAVIGFGASISVSGLSLLFPFQINLFAHTFELLNNLGISGLLGLGELKTALAPHEEMQYAQMWHAIIAFVFIAVIFAHIYIGTLGMEGALDAMTSGEVDEQWAKEHHSLWVDEVQQAKSKSSAQPSSAE